jgi:hypothetical protein
MSSTSGPHDQRFGPRRRWGGFRRRRAYYVPQLEALETRNLPSFIAAPAYFAGITPSSVAVGDFNGDGTPDLAVTDNFGNSVSILLGQGDGTFRGPSSFSAGPNAISVAVGDFNGDGIPDLAVANDLPNGTVSILLGRGDGTFQAPRSYTVGSSPRAVAVGDFNGDGSLDLAVTNSGSNTVSVLLGRGDGTFQAARTFAAGPAPYSVAVGDFNHDGYADLAVANNTSPGTVSVMLGQGDGTFQAATSYAAGSFPESVAVGDFNGDGRLDLAVANYATNNVSVLLGNGDGSFQAAVNYVAGSGPIAVAVGDFNGDGTPDLAVANRGSGSVSVLLGQGDGTFQAATNYAAAAGPYSVAVGDFNGDRILDIAVANNDSNTVSVLLGNGDGAFRAATSYAVGALPTSVAVADFNGDGITDLAVADEGVSHGNGSGVSVLLGNGDGTFQAATNYAAGSVPISVVMGDFNGDGRLDLAVANRDSNNVSVLLGNGDGTFQAAQSFSAGTKPISVAVGDFNGDGLLDLAVVDQGDSQGRGKGVSALLGNGDGTFQAAASYAAGMTPTSVAVGDFNGDGIADLVVTDSYAPGTVNVLLGNGDGSFQALVAYPAGSSATSVVVGDFNGDGIFDLAVADDDPNPTFSGVSVLLGNGDGSFHSPVRYAAGLADPRSVAVGDFNGDGIPDLAVTNYPNLGGIPSVNVLLGNGDGSFRGGGVYAAGASPVAVAVGDFNGDGRPDLGVANQFAGDVSLLLNDGVWGGAAPGEPRSRGSFARPRTSVGLPSPLPNPVLRLDASVATLPATTGPLEDDSQPLFRPDVDPSASGVALAERSATPVTVPPSVGARLGAPAPLLDRLFVEPESGWLWNRSADEPWWSGR